MRGHFNCKLLKTMFLCVACMLFICMSQLVKANDMPYDKVHMGDYIAGYASLGKDNIITQKNDDGSWNVKKTDAGDYKVLQLTDVHLSAGDVYTERNIKAMNAVYSIIEQVRPDIIEMTGDYVFAMPYTDNSQDYETFKMCMKFMDQIGIPWIWTFGNHDHDFFDRYTQEQVHSMLELSDTLIKYDIDYNVDGYSNGEFRLYNSDDTLNRILISVDSHDYLTDGNYDYIHDNQVSWYTDVINNDKKLFGEDVQSFVYTHIPLMEYNDAWYAYQGGDTRAEYISGTKREDVCCSSVRGRMGTAMSQLNSTQAVFCGHDHLNDYIIKYCGVTYAYSKSIDYSAYEGIENLTEQRGATLLTLANDGNNYNIISILLTDIQNADVTKNGLFYNNGEWEYYRNGRVDYDYTGIVYDEKVGWWYVENGKVDFNCNGLKYNEYGWWKISGGRVDFDCTGVVYDEKVGWWYVENGEVDFNCNGLKYNEYGWWKLNGGHVDFDCTGVVYDEEAGWWYVENGEVDFNCNGLKYNEYGWWKLNGGHVDFDCTGIVYDEEAGWWYVENGEVDFNCNGLKYNEYGLWKLNEGRVDFDYTGITYDEEAGWWYVENGEADLDCNGIKHNENGWWKINEGRVDFEYTGIINDEEGTWDINNGYASLVSK